MKAIQYEKEKTRHAIVCASYLLLIKDEKILLLRRSNTGYEDGNYSVPAGHVDEGEPVRRCLVREAKEEIGVTIQENDATLRHVLHRNKREGGFERLDFFFTCKKWKGEITNMEPEKCDDLSWFAVDTLPENTIPYIREAIVNSFSDKNYNELYW